MGITKIFENGQISFFKDNYNCLITFDQAWKTIIVIEFPRYERTNASEV